MNVNTDVKVQSPVETRPDGAASDRTTLDVGTIEYLKHQEDQKALDAKANLRQTGLDSAPVFAGMIGVASGAMAGLILRRRGASAVVPRAAGIGALVGAASLGIAGISYYKTDATRQAGEMLGASAAQLAVVGVAGLAAVKVFRGGGSTAAEKVSQTKMLDQYSRDLTAAARADELGPAFGVDDKVDELVAVLGATKKNNPLIVGPAGTGKTAVVEELARRIAAGNVPDHLKNVRLVSVDLDAMVAGTKYRGMFEERLQGVLNEVRAGEGDIIPFVDETHKLVNAGSSREAEGAGNSVKPLLARGELRMIGATTDVEASAIRADGALARRFTEISYEEPTGTKTLAIVRSSAARFERDDVIFTDDALQSSVKLTDPIKGRFQPDKALTLLDTTSSRIAIARDAVPLGLRDAEAKLGALQAEWRILGRERNPASRARAEQMGVQIEKLKTETGDLRADWTRALEARKGIDSAYAKLSTATGDERAQAQAHVDSLEAAAAPMMEKYPATFKREITPADIAESPLPTIADEQAKAKRLKVGFSST